MPVDYDWYSPGTADNGGIARVMPGNDRNTRVGQAWRLAETVTPMD